MLCVVTMVRCVLCSTAAAGTAGAGCGITAVHVVAVTDRRRRCCGRECSLPSLSLGPALMSAPLPPLLLLLLLLPLPLPLPPRSLLRPRRRPRRDGRAGLL